MSNFIKIDNETVVNKSLIASVLKDVLQSKYTSDIDYRIRVVYTTEFIQTLSFEYENLRDIEYDRITSELLEK